MSEEQGVGDGEGAEEQADEAVGGHEGEVDFGDVGGGDEGLFDEQEDGRAEEAEPEEEVEVAGDADGEEGEEGDGVADAGEGDCVAASEGSGDGVEFFAAVKVFVLQGVEDVEASDPEHHAGAEE